ncbi:thiazole synthase [Vampirovibrio chlorellavorus]|uniref:thiazole synthase n=1 Tax=Vampirovibrio chlorellavorus TaxID=758823 RepID=UPI0026E9B952|nr:thiazole synthase [Vampirovibrio chlorellavorus]
MSQLSESTAWHLGGETVNSRLLVGTALYPSPAIMLESIDASGTEVVTVSLRRQSPGSKGGESFWELLKDKHLKVLPNTAGCRNAKEAITTAHMAREIFNTPWIKLEVIGDDFTLQPDPFGLVEAAKALIKEGFEVFPYMTEDFMVAQKLVDAGCRILMPWAAPIGTGKGPMNLYALKLLRARLPQVQLIADAGIGLPSHASQVMEIGFDGVLLNSAIALAEHPPQMAQAFAQAVEAGRLAYLAGPMPQRDMAQPSTPVLGTPFWHQTSQKAGQSV